MTFYGKCKVLIEIVAFLLTLLLALKILSFDESILLLNKEHSRPFEQCWPLRDHLVLCESLSPLQTFYHMKITDAGGF